MNYLSLFSGACGGDLAFQHLLTGFKCVGYVEIDDYCQRVIRQRQKDGLLDEAPIYGDIRTFISEGYAERYRGMVDLITGGDPCQSNSSAWTHGKRSEHLASEFIKTIRIIRPTFIIRENPAGVRCDAPSPDWKFKEWVESLGYTATLTEIRACCMGADHKRARVFVCAELTDTHGKRLEGWDSQKTEKDGENSNPSIQTLVQNYTWPDVSDPYAYGSNDGLACRVDRTRAIGNGQVPQVAATAWRILS